MKKPCAIQSGGARDACARDRTAPGGLRALLDHLDRRHEAMIREAAARAIDAARAAPEPEGRFGVH